MLEVELVVVRILLCGRNDGATNAEVCADSSAAVRQQHVLIISLVTPLLASE